MYTKEEIKRMSSELKKVKLSIDKIAEHCHLSNTTIRHFLINPEKEYYDYTLKQIDEFLTNYQNTIKWQMMQQMPNHWVVKRRQS